MLANRAAQRYAKSLLDLAQSQGVLEQVHQDMELIRRMCRESRPLLNMLRSSIITHDKKYKALQALLQGKTHALTNTALKLIAQKNREKILPQVAECFHEEYNEHKQIAEASILTPVPLHPSLEEKLKTVVKKISRRQEVILKKKEDAALIGGFLLDVGDIRIDASVKNKLRRLQTKFNQK